MMRRMMITMTGRTIDINRVTSIGCVMNNVT